MTDRASWQWPKETHIAIAACIAVCVAALCILLMVVSANVTHQNRVTGTAQAHACHVAHASPAAIGARIARAGR